jgi:PhnB protein
MRISCHLNFDGACRRAFVEYQSILGGELATLLTFGESPIADQVPAEWAPRILHATLSVDGQAIFGSDTFPGEPACSQGFAVTLNTQDLARAEGVFSRLAEGGSIKMPLQQTFWAHSFGVVVDRFGVTWEINCAHVQDHAEQSRR